MYENLSGGWCGMINFKFAKAIGDVHIPLCYRRYFVYVMEQKKKKDDVPANGQHQSTNFSKFGTSDITFVGLPTALA